jgi:hypothetical protein
VIVSQKAALSLLISLVLFSVFTVLAFTGLFDLVETRYYNPSITASLNREVIRDMETIDGFLSELRRRFAATLKEGAVQRSFLPNQDAEDILERSRLYGSLLESLGGLQFVQFIGTEGSRIHYSTRAADVLRQDDAFVVYRNYQDSTNIPYSWIAVGGGESRLILDGAGDRLLFSFPFYDSFAIHRGVALFSLSVKSVAEQLIAAGRIKAGENVSVVSNPPGLVLGLPHQGKNTLIPLIASVWKEGVLSPSGISSTEPAVNFILFSVKTSQGIFVGRLAAEALFVFPKSMKIILLVSFILTVYIMVFLFMNLRQDPLAVIQNRLKHLQVSLIEEYYEHKNDVNRTQWQWELEQRREEVRNELKRGLNPKTGINQEIDFFIDKAWDELLAVIGKQRTSQVTTTIDEEKLQSILDRIVLAAPRGIHPPSSAYPEEEPEELEELEKLEESEGLVADGRNFSQAVSDVATVEESENMEVPVEKTEIADAAVSAVSANEDVSDNAVKPVYDPVKSKPMEEVRLLDIVEFIEEADLLEDEYHVEELEDAKLLTLDEPAELTMPVFPVERTTAGSSLPDDVPEQLPDTEYGNIDGELEIVSPLETLLSDFAGEVETAGGESGQTAAGAVLEELDSPSVPSLVYKPFQFQFNHDGNFEILEVLEEEADSEFESADTEKVVEVRDGINFINEKFLEVHEETDRSLDPEMKNLITEVVNKSLSD